MPQVIIALGSNTRQEAHIQWASERLAHVLDNIRLSRKIWTPDIHGTGKMYLNRLLLGNTNLSIEALEGTLKLIEAETGRNRQQVTIDLDLMQYDAQKFHLNDWPRPYIQNLLPDIL